jgi:hypothetical protein
MNLRRAIEFNMKRPHKALCIASPDLPNSFAVREVLEIQRNHWQCSLHFQSSIDPTRRTTVILKMFDALRVSAPPLLLGSASV